MTRRHLLAWVTLIAALTVVLTAGCGVRPTGVITGGPAPTGDAFGRPGTPPSRGEGVALYLLADAALTPVLRPTRRPLSPTQTLALLQVGPDADERAANLTSEVPAGLDPVAVTTSATGDVTVRVSADVRTLSTAAVDQIVCTVRDALTTTAPVTLTSDAASRGSRACPVPG
jgi:hypothetical protein